MIKKLKFFLIVTFLFLSYSNIIYAQKPNDSLFKAFASYSKISREITFAHLNKSTYIKGETMGFTSYVLDKKSKKPSLLTTNLYCIIEDSNKTIVKSKLIKITNGVANANFNIDTTFTSGDYVFKAYTNWQKNFNEQNFYTQPFKVLNIDKENNNNNTDIAKLSIDAQFLPESGHAIYDVENTFGVITKNKYGNSIANVSGKVLDSENNIIISFKTNHLGIGRFSFTPSSDKKYNVELNIDEKKYLFKLNNIEKKGVTLNLKRTNSKVIISLKTNKKTQRDIKNEAYRLTIHNGDKLEIIEIDFRNKTEITSLINLSKLNTGINVFTLFNSENKPILERLFFNYNGINTLNKVTSSFSKLADSTIINLKFDASNYNNLSISVLPENTRSYNHHHNILSYTFLQPYINSYIENAKYYFTDISSKKMQSLDNLLITQGWSSYNWFNIFNNPPKVNYVFEKGIYFKANINNSKSNKFIMYPTQNNKSMVFDTSIGDSKFELRDFYPINNEKLNIAEFNKKGDLKKPGLYIQFYPSKISSIKNKIEVLKTNSNFKNINTVNNVFLSSNLDKTQKLDEVYIESKKKEKRLEKLRRSSWGKIDIWNDNMRERTPNLMAYFSSYFATGIDAKGNPYIINRNANSLTGRTNPLVFLNDLPLLDLAQISSIPMTTIDYIEINKSGIGEGIRGGAGVIKIYTNDNLMVSNNSKGKNYKSYKIPLTFSEDKKFYKPVYTSYTSDFFKYYGVIDWISNLKINNNGIASFKIENPKIKSIKLFIEGMTNDGDFISTTKVVNLN